MESEVECAARAIHTSDDTGREWGALDESSREVYRDRARAAITVIRSSGLELRIKALEYAASVHHSRGTDARFLVAEAEKIERYLRGET